MRFLLDENFPKAAADMLAARGHQVFDFRGSVDEGIEDDLVFQKAQALNAILLTTDRDFFHTVPHLYAKHSGVVVIALRQPNRAAIMGRLEWLLSNVSESAWVSRVFQLRDQSWIVFPPLADESNTIFT